MSEAVGPRAEVMAQFTAQAGSRSNNRSAGSPANVVNLACRSRTWGQAMTDQAQAVPPAPRFTPPRFVTRLWNSRWIVRARKFVFPEDEQTYSDPKFDYLNPEKLIRTGLIVVVVFFVGILGWGSLAPLDSAIVAQGVVVVETHRKTIQHLEGGIVRTIYVRDGRRRSGRRRSAGAVG